MKSGMEPSHCHHFQDFGCKENLTVSEGTTNIATSNPWDSYGDTDVMHVAASVTGM
jgi:hypothetical protein